MHPPAAYINEIANFFMLVVFRGGLEDNVVSESETVRLGDLSGQTVRDLIVHIEKHLLKNSYKHFATGGELEGGILCVVNETDLDILEGGDTPLRETDTVHFISTMHGG